MIGLEVDNSSPVVGIRVGRVEHDATSEVFNRLELFEFVMSLSEAEAGVGAPGVDLERAGEVAGGALEIVPGEFLGAGLDESVSVLRRKGRGDEKQGGEHSRQLYTRGGGNGQRYLLDGGARDHRYALDRLDARDLAAEVEIILRAVGLRRVVEDRFAVARRFGEPHVRPDLRFEDLVLEVALDLGDRLAREALARVVHAGGDARDLERRIQPPLGEPDRPHETA